MFIVGIGPGGPDHLSFRAREVLSQVEAVAGYTTYIELIASLVEGKHIIKTGMKKEVDRVNAALDTALSGETCAVVSSGDPGIYAMASLVFEALKIRGVMPVRPGETALNGQDALMVEVVPGIPALSAGASLLGAPLSHDFAVISLSDLLTPWEMIEKRVHAAAEADFVIVIYNPKSKKRNWQLEETKDIVMKYRDPKTPCGVVTAAMRDDQKTEIVYLEDLGKADVAMQTIVFIGNSASAAYGDYIITPRGYAKKYDI